MTTNLAVEDDDDADDVSPSAPFGKLKPGQTVIDVTGTGCQPGWIVDDYGNVSPPPVRH